MSETVAKIIDGSVLSKEVLDNLKKEVKTFTENYKISPGLGLIMMGNNPSGKSYVRQNKKACDRIGIDFFEFVLPEEATEKDYINKLKELNNDKNIHGILLQFPLPEEFSENKIVDSINPLKDVDCIHPLNQGKINLGSPHYYPGTPLGIYKMCRLEGIEMEGKHVVIIGSSNIVGKPLANMLLDEDVGATVTVCHIKTKKLIQHTLMADILVVAIGNPEFIKAYMVKEGAVVIDVGINFIPDKNSKKGYRLVGDVAFDEVREEASAITPVPGGVGPMTIAMIMENTLKAAKKLSS